MSDNCRFRIEFLPNHERFVDFELRHVPESVPVFGAVSPAVEGVEYTLQPQTVTLIFEFDGADSLTETLIRDPKERKYVLNR